MLGIRADRTGGRMEWFRSVAESTSVVIDSVGILVIVAGIAFALYRLVHPPAHYENRYRLLRHDLGRGILLGLELMVAGDIIRTVAVEPTLDSVIVLGVIVLIRTFLSMSLEVELEGRWPWRRAEAEPAPTRQPSRPQ
jgi:uncharacterized membrane protein